MPLWKSATAITPEALAGDDDGHEHDGYTRDSLALAIAEGVRPDGDPVGRDMPRWQLAESDMQDLVAFLLPEDH